MLQSKDKKNRLFFYILIMMLLTTINTDYKKKKNQSIMSIKKIQVSGLSNVENFKVKETLNSLSLKNIFFLKKEDLIKILNKNNLIESISVKKVYPNLLNITIKKTDFLAVTNIGNDKFIIASNGKLLSYNNVDINGLKLPFVFGEVDNKYFKNLKEIIDKSKFEYEKIEAFYFFPSNRMDIKTIDGVLIKLPKKNLSQTLRLVNLIKEKDEFKNNKILDLRITNHIITSNE